MEIPKPSLSAEALRTLATPLGERGTPAASAGALLADRSSIKPLDLAGALQVLIAELRLALVEAGFHPPDALDPAALQRWAADTADNAEVTAPRLAQPLLELFIANLPPEGDPPASWLAAVQRLEQVILRAGAAAIERIASWRDTPAAIPSLLRRALEIVVPQIHEDAPPPLLARPDWPGLAALQRFRRLRRRQRRLAAGEAAEDWLELEDPDAAPHGEKPSPRERRG